MSKDSGTKNIAVYDSKGNFLSFCSRDRAEKVIETGKGKYVGERTIKLNVAKIKDSKERHSVIREADRVCYICRKTISKKDIATVDHVIPKSRDEFANHKFNKKCCCLRCNNDKADRTLTEYVAYIKKNRHKYMYLSDKRIDFLEAYAEHYEREYYNFYVKYVNQLGGSL